MIPNDVLEILESDPDTSSEKLNVSIRFHIIKIREIRAVGNVADVIFVAVQTWELPQIANHFKGMADSDLPHTTTVETSWCPPLIILNADSLSSSPSHPTVNWRAGVLQRKTYYNGTVTNELSNIF